MGPYRELVPHVVTPPPRDPEARVIGVLLVVLGVLRLAVALAVHEALGAEASVALGLGVLGAVGLARARR